MTRSISGVFRLFFGSLPRTTLNKLGIALCQAIKKQLHPTIVRAVAFPHYS
jgi:hypothetical protein